MPSFSFAQKRRKTGSFVSPIKTGIPLPWRYRGTGIHLMEVSLWNTQAEALQTPV